jgi:hypothetical protein
LQTALGRCSSRSHTYGCTDPYRVRSDVDLSPLRRSDDCDRTTHRRSDNTPFPTAGEEYIMICPGCFIAEYPTSPHALTAAVPALLQPNRSILSTALMLCPARPSSAYGADSLVLTRLGNSVFPPEPRCYNPDGSNGAFKTHSSFVPNPKGFLQRAISKAPRTDHCSPPSEPSFAALLPIRPRRSGKLPFVPP